jgi:hypothetical protein
MGVRVDAPNPERYSWFPRMLRKLVQRMEETAPAGADLRSWKY